MRARLWSHLLVMLLISCVFSTPVFAKPFRTLYFNGAFIGGNVGWQLGTFQEENFYNTTVLGGIVTSKHFASDHGITDGFDIGLGFTLRRLYLGVDFNKNFGKFQDTTEFELDILAGLFRHEVTTVETQLQSDIGVNFTPGIMLTPSTLLYGVVGVERAKFHVTSQSAFSFGGATAPADVSENKNLSGFRLGVGLLKYISSHLAVGLEFDHTNYRFASVAALGVTGVNSTAIETKIRTSKIALLFKANWYFNNATRRDFYVNSMKTSSSNMQRMSNFSSTSIRMALPDSSLVSKADLKLPEPHVTHTLVNLPRPSSTLVVLPGPTNTQFG